jgi:hypothetical protein
MHSEHKRQEPVVDAFNFLRLPVATAAAAAVAAEETDGKRDRYIAATKGDVTVQ